MIGWEGRSGWLAAGGSGGYPCSHANPSSAGIKKHEDFKALRLFRIARMSEKYGTRQHSGWIDRILSVEYIETNNYK